MIIMLIAAATFSIYRLQAQPISYYSGAIPVNNTCVTFAGTTGAECSFYGCGAGTSNTAAYNSFFGDHAGFSNTTGSKNIAIGYQALYYNTTAADNTAVRIPGAFCQYHRRL